MRIDSFSYEIGVMMYNAVTARGGYVGDNYDILDNFTALIQNVENEVLLDRLKDGYFEESRNRNMSDNDALKIMEDFFIEHELFGYDE